MSEQIDAPNCDTLPEFRTQRVHLLFAARCTVEKDDSCPSGEMPRRTRCCNRPPGGAASGAIRAVNQREQPSCSGSETWGVASKEVMAQHSVKRHRARQRFTPCSQARRYRGTRSSSAPCGPAALKLHNRTDRWQRPATRQNLRGLLAPNGGAHRWSGRLGSRAEPLPPVQGARPFRANLKKRFPTRTGLRSGSPGRSRHTESAIERSAETRW